MTPTLATEPETMADLLDRIERLGGIPADRILMKPTPGTATEADLLAAARRPRKRICELLDGILVEKAMGLRESFLAVFLSALLNEFVRTRNLGIITGEQGTMRIVPGLVRIPDIAFLSWDRLPGRRIPDEPIPQVFPDLAVEILSESNTPGEMERKRRELFAAGTRLVWEVNPRNQTAAVYTSPSDVVILTEADALDGGDVLPGFVLPLRDLFGELDRRG
jgi:Uma2 family endonuclease